MTQKTASFNIDRKEKGLLKRNMAGSNRVRTFVMSTAGLEETLTRKCLF
jgi:hypothetical protein